MPYRIGRVGDRILYAPTYQDAQEAIRLLEDYPGKPEALSMVEALVSDYLPVVSSPRKKTKRQRTLVDELTDLPVRQAGGAACLKERDAVAIARRGDRTIGRLRRQVRELRKELQTPHRKGTA
jgi:hypothetical protein